MLSPTAKRLSAQRFLETEASWTRQPVSETMGFVGWRSGMLCSHCGTALVGAEAVLSEDILPSAPARVQIPLPVTDPVDWRPHPGRSPGHQRCAQVRTSTPWIFRTCLLWLRCRAYPSNCHLPHVPVNGDSDTSDTDEKPPRQPSTPLPTLAPNLGSFVR